MKHNNNYFLLSVDDTYFLSPSDEIKEDDNNVMFLNETSAFIYKLLDDEQSFDSLVEKLTDEYNVDVDTAKKDIDGFISFLKENKCLVQE